ncbi:MAG: methyltransferase [Bacteroidetes bacterium]|nr:methyltransferase [Bacteroidota bacterium]MBT7143649.1 methyltransferase [Bacteroidota bacterium]MBT7490165.1 methyltransferase [Bacteroidota bacterium]
MIRLSKLFKVYNGLASSNVTIVSDALENFIPYIRPAKTLQRTIAGYVDQRTVPSRHIYPTETIYVSTDGEGSHTYAYVSSYNFIPNSNVAVLIPKIELTLNQKLYYAKCITLNRYKFSYGRKPKGERLSSISIPEINEIPSWVSDFNTDIFLSVSKPKNLDKKVSIPVFKELTTLDSLFNLENGIGKVGLKEKEIRFNNSIIYVRPASSFKRTLRSFIDRDSVVKNKIYPVGTLFVSTNGEGSHSYSYVSTEEIVPNSDVSVLIPKQPMSIEVKLFYAQCITANRYLFSYGRKPKGARLLNIKVPDVRGSEDRVVDFINSLKYSSVI